MGGRVMCYVYILSDYEEYGATNVVATLERDLLDRLIDENWPDGPRPTFGDQEHLAKWRDRARSKLRLLLEQSDAQLAQPDGHDLHNGWGGMQLHVVKLAEREK